MNRRQWKKRCKKAAAELERRWPGEYGLVPADGDETVYAPRDYEPLRCEGRLGRKYTSPPRGAPGQWIRVSPEYDDWDFHPADGLLEFATFVQDTDWQALAQEIAP